MESLKADDFWHADGIIQILITNSKRTARIIKFKKINTSSVGIQIFHLHHYWRIK